MGVKLRMFCYKRRNPVIKGETRLDVERKEIKDNTWRRGEVKQRLEHGEENVI